MNRYEQEIEKLRDEKLALLEEIEEWKKATGLEKCGDPDVVTPEDARVYWENFEKANTSPVLYWSHVPTIEDGGGWNHIESCPDHCLKPVISVRRIMDQAHAAMIEITCQDLKTKKEIIIANVIVPFRNDIGDCSVCEGRGSIVFGGGEEETECPWCLGDKQSAMDEAKEIACAIYWSWLRSPNGGAEYNFLPVDKKEDPCVK